MPQELPNGEPNIVAIELQSKVQLFLGQLLQLLLFQTEVRPNLFKVRSELLSRSLGRGNSIFSSPNAREDRLQLHMWWSLLPNICAAALCSRDIIFT